MLEKLWCSSCEKFVDYMYRNSYGSSRYKWTGSEYEWYDNDNEGEEGEDEFCEECGETLEMREFTENNWKGNSKCQT